MIPDNTATFALSFCMIIFPAFVIIPSAFAVYRRNAEFYFQAFLMVSFGIAGLTLVIAVIYTDIALFSLYSAVGFSLGILISLITVGILFFLFKLQRWLWELAMLEEYRKAEAAE